MNKNIIITGGAQGIGKITALELLKNGYTVSVFEIDEEANEEFKSEVGNERIAFFKTDVSDEKSVQQSVKASVERFGNISGLVNNAAIQIDKPVTELSIDEWNRVIGVNLTGAFLCSKHAAPFLKETNGSIINFCSTRAFQSEANTEAYSASKGGIFSLTHALAISLGPEIRVNCISPGWIDVSGVKKKSKAKQYQCNERRSFATSGRQSWKSRRYCQYGFVSAELRRTVLSPGKTLSSTGE